MIEETIHKLINVCFSFLHVPIMSVTMYHFTSGCITFFLIRFAPFLLFLRSIILTVPLSLSVSTVLNTFHVNVFFGNRLYKQLTGFVQLRACWMRE